jgi:hypothetical protein
MWRTLQFNDLLARKCGSWAFFQPLMTSRIRKGAQMILFPLMSLWIWFQVFTASPLFGSTADVASLNTEIVS